MSDRGLQFWDEYIASLTEAEYLDLPQQKESNPMFTRKFMSQAIERSVRAGAASLLSVLGAGQVNLLSVPWEAALGVAGGGALVSLLVSVAAGHVGDHESTSFLP